MKLTLILAISLLSSLSLISCGGGGDDEVTIGDEGPTGVAVISTDNEKALATAATEAIKSAINSDTAPTLGFRTASKNYDFATINNMSDLICTGGGTLIMDIDDSTGNSVITYTDCAIGDGAVVNGIVNITTTVAGDILTTTTSYDNYTMVIGDETQSFDFSSVCQFNTSTSAFNCIYDSNTLGIDGRIYSVSGSTVSGDAFIGYTVSATVTDPDYGTLSITTDSPIMFNCSNGQPESGVIQFTDGDGNTVLVTYDSCTSFTVSYNGTSNPYSW